MEQKISSQSALPNLADKPVLVSRRLFGGEADTADFQYADPIPFIPACQLVYACLCTPGLL